jgi:hypothetical protein
MRPLVMETDIGHDADDVFALLYFLGLEAPLKAVCVSPGDHYQVAIVKAFLKRFHVDAPVLTPKARVSKDSEPNGFHSFVIHQAGGSALTAAPDGHEDELPKEPVDVFICGPAKMAHLLDAQHITFQGGFVPYSQHRPTKVLDKFEGKEFCPTFNLGGTKPGVWGPLIERKVPHLWVGKNQCHTIVYTPEVHAKHCPKPSAHEPEALRLHRLFVEKYIGEKGAKAWHDPLAATLKYNDDIGIWKKLKPVRQKGEWSAVPTDEDHKSLVDLHATAPAATAHSSLVYEDQPWGRYFEGLQGVRVATHEEAEAARKL